VMNKKELYVALTKERAEISRRITRAQGALRRKLDGITKNEGPTMTVVEEVAALNRTLDGLIKAREKVDFDLVPFAYRQRRAARRKRAKAAKRKKKRPYQEVKRTKVSGGLPGLGKRR